jgi:hypothetical protein
MNALQGWLFVLVLGGLALRGFDRLRVAPDDLAYAGLAVALAVAQKVFLHQVTLDDVLFAPWFVALPVIASRRRGARAGFTVALAQWLVLAAVAGALPVDGGGDLPQETFLLATLFGAVSAGVAAHPDARVGIPLGCLGWIAFAAVRARPLAFEPGLVAVPLFAAAWACVAELRRTPRGAP